MSIQERRRPSSPPRPRPVTAEQQTGAAEKPLSAALNPVAEQPQACSDARASHDAPSAEASPQVTATAPAAFSSLPLPPEAPAEAVEEPRERGPTRLRWFAAIIFHTIGKSQMVFEADSLLGVKGGEAGQAGRLLLMNLPHSDNSNMPLLCPPSETPFDPKQRQRPAGCNHWKRKNQQIGRLLALQESSSQMQPPVCIAPVSNKARAVTAPKHFLFQATQRKNPPNQKARLNPCPRLQDPYNNQGTSQLQS